MRRAMSMLVREVGVGNRTVMLKQQQRLAAVGSHQELLLSVSNHLSLRTLMKPTLWIGSS